MTRKSRKITVLSEAADWPKSRIQAAARAEYESEKLAALDEFDALDCDLEEEDPFESLGVTPPKESRKDDLFWAPGLISDIMDLTLSTAYYTTPQLAFGGAIALMATLISKKVAYKQTRPNMFVLCLAPTGCGKDAPRRVNSAIIQASKLTHKLAGQFASPEGVEDTMLKSDVCLSQIDEMDAMLSAISSEKDNRQKALAAKILEIWSGSNNILPTRSKSGGVTQHIYYPHLNILGTCTPEGFYRSINEHMITSGFMSRCLIIESKSREKGGKQNLIVPVEILDQVHEWTKLDFEEDDGPKMLGITDEANSVLTKFENDCDAKYNDYLSRGMIIEYSIWSRVAEMANKMALLFSASLNSDVISLESVNRAIRIALQQAEFSLKQFASQLCESDSDRKLKKILRIVSENKNKRISYSELLRRSKLLSRDFKFVMETLKDSNMLLDYMESKSDKARGFSGRWFALNNTVNREYIRKIPKPQVKDNR